MNLVNVPLNDVLNVIEENTRYTFLVNEEFVDVSRKVDAVFVNTPVKEILEKMLEGQNIQFVSVNRQIVLSSKNAKSKEAIFQPVTVTGKVADAKTGEPLAGLNVQVKGTNIGAITDSEGNYSIQIHSADAILVFSHIGYKTEEFVTKGISIINVSMREVATELETVIVTAFGIRRTEKALGYSVQRLDGESIQTIKIVDPTTSLTGKISGLLVKNSTNFGTAPIVNLRGEIPLLVIDGVPSVNISINDISPDDIKSIDVLKGATASAIYGYRGAKGAIIITTLRGGEEKGLSISVNSSSMLNLGFVASPETQTSYSSGYNGKYGNDYVWGDRLDIGRTATLWDPIEMQWKDNSLLVSKGSNNLRNFQQQGFITNNNISITSQSEHSSLRSSVSHVYSKGQFPNQKLDKITYSLGGLIEMDKLTLESNFSYTKNISPNVNGNQYSGGYLYNLIGWVGAEWDVRDYSDYWLVKDKQQNWFNNDWYDNPYFVANEVVKKSDRDVLNGFINASYKLNSWLKLSLRAGLDSHLDRFISQNPVNARNAWSKYGYFRNEKYSGYSLNNDLFLSIDKTAGDFRIEGLLGGTLFYNKEDYFNAFTQGGLSVPGFYSLKASVDPIGWETYLRARQVNSLFGRMSLSWKSIAYLDVTGRNDWSSTLVKDTRSYFYPSFAASLIVSELLPKLTWLDMWKLRSSWTVSKTPAGIYDINDNYYIRNNVWGGYNSAYISTVLSGRNVRPQTSQTYEFGTAGMFLKNRFLLDFAVYHKRVYDFLTSASVSDATGFDSKYVNSDEEHLKKGIEITVGGTPLKTASWTWKTNLNWSRDITCYDKLDKQYSPDNLWAKVGERVDAYTVRDWIRDPDGNIINTNGFPVKSDYYSVAGFTNPDWIWGLNSNLSYKDVTLSFSVDGRVGGVSFSRLDALLWNSGAHIGTDNQWRYDEVVNGLSNYVGPGVKLVSGSVSYDSYGRITSDTRVFAENDTQVSYESYMRSHYALGAWNYASQDVLQETFFKLREVSVSYQLPESIVNKLSLKQFLISLVGQNLFYWGKQYKFADPDYGQTWDLVSPSIRYLGINLKFNF
jgi:TonB-linked SusC/RagA family outer membrane protein